MDSLRVLVDFQPKKLGWRSPYIGSLADLSANISLMSAFGGEAARKRVQAGTIDALLAALCVRHELMMLTMDKDFHKIASIVPLSLWIPEA